MSWDYHGPITALGVLIIVVRSLSQVEWWQRKEYRLDRMISQLTSAENYALFSPGLVAALIAAIVAWGSFFTGYSFLASLFGYLSLGLWFCYDALRAVRRGVFRPTATTKGITLLLAVWCGAGGLFWVLHQGHVPLGLAFATILTILPVVTAGAVLVVNLPFALRKKDIIAKAGRIRQQHSHLTVVGITGSYGKTSTKFFLQQLLQDDPTVVATQEHRNSALAVAQDLLRQLRPHHRTYLVEMGAYRRGEIRELCELTKPKIGVVTAIASQHLSLFGSLEAVAAAKWELIDALPVRGTVVLNADNKIIQERGKNIPQRVIWFSSALQSHPSFATVYLTDTTIYDRKIATTLHLAEVARNVVLPLVSEAMLGSAVAAAATAYALGTSPATIFHQLAHLKPFPRTMEYRRNSSGTALIDDSYSGNEQGVLAAIEHLRYFTGAKKIVVFTPIIELGRSGSAVHERIGRALAQSQAAVYVTNASYAQAIVRGGKKTNPAFRCTVVNDAQELLAQVRPRLTTNTVVLLEGRLPEFARQALLN